MGRGDQRAEQLGGWQTHALIRSLAELCNAYTQLRERAVRKHRLQILLLNAPHELKGIECNSLIRPGCYTQHAQNRCPTGANALCTRLHHLFQAL